MMVASAPVVVIAPSAAAVIDVRRGSRTSSCSSFNATSDVPAVREEEHRRDRSSESVHGAALQLEQRHVGVEVVDERIRRCDPFALLEDRLPMINATSCRRAGAAMKFCLLSEAFIRSSLQNDIAPADDLKWCAGCPDLLRSQARQGSWCWRRRGQCSSCWSATLRAFVSRIASYRRIVYRAS